MKDQEDSTTLFGDRLQQVLDETGMSQSDLARKMKVNQPQINHWTAGRQTPSYHNIVKILRAIPTLDAHWLLTGEHF